MNNNEGEDYDGEFPPLPAAAAAAAANNNSSKKNSSSSPPLVVELTAGGSGPRFFAPALAASLAVNAGEALPREASIGAHFPEGTANKSGQFVAPPAAGWVRGVENFFFALSFFFFFFEVSKK